HRQLEGRLAAPRSLALPLLRRGAPGPGSRTRADLLRTFLTPLPRRSQALRTRGRSPALCGGVCPARRHAGRVRILPRLRARRSGLRAAGHHASRHADAGAHRREGSGEFLIEQAKLVASDVRGIVVKGSGHWLMDEAPAAVMPAIIDFVN